MAGSASRLIPSTRVLASGSATVCSHGASLTEIGEVLSHRNPETSMIYTKVDLDSLRPLALPWPGGVR